MGGNAFLSTNLRRIQHNEIEPTLKKFVKKLKYPELDWLYVSQNIVV
jgi:hypothetical protein